MFARIIIICCAVALSGLALAAPDEAGPDNNWLMMVKTNSTDPAREDEFNHWYNEIDIPDVLEVPGYMRARRGQLEALSATHIAKGEAKYVALYNITTDDMDGTIIDMLLASWNMEKKDRSTSLIEVTERLYYRQYSDPYDTAAEGDPGKEKYLFLVRAACCSDAAAEARFNQWYAQSYMPALSRVDGLRRATRYQLHRVVMIEPVAIPQFLGVFEISADSPQQAMANVRKALDEVTAAGRKAGVFEETDSRLYHLIKDVRRAE